MEPEVAMHRLKKISFFQSAAGYCVIFCLKYSTFAVKCCVVITWCFRIMNYINAHKIDDLLEQRFSCGGSGEI